MFLSLVLSKIQSYLRQRQTMRELERLSEVELRDIGLTRSDITSVARRR